MKPPKPGRIQGVDSLRFICALVVMFGHLGLTGERIHGNAYTGLLKIAIGLLNSAFNGPAAVIVFFVLSGFCIHLPFRAGRPFATPPYFARRFLRIIPPALATVLIMWSMHGSFPNIQSTILWSVICEAIYYFIYPILLSIRRASNWAWLIVVAYICSFLLIGAHFEQLKSGAEYTKLGSETWIVGLPCWLLGCWLVEQYESFSPPSTLRLWCLRIGVLSISIVLRAVKFHVSSPFASNCITLNMFAILACYWVGKEIAYATKNGPTEILERNGRWSYSLYLIHPLIIPLLALSGLSTLTTLPGLHLLVLTFALAASYGFYLAVEAPSHRLAIRVGNYLSAATQKAATEPKRP